MRVICIADKLLRTQAICESSGVARTDILTHTQENPIKFLPNIAARTGATLKWKNLLPERAVSMRKEETI